MVINFNVYFELTYVASVDIVQSNLSLPELGVSSEDLHQNFPNFPTKPKGLRSKSRMR